MGHKSVTRRMATAEVSPTCTFCLESQLCRNKKIQLNNCSVRLGVFRSAVFYSCKVTLTFHQYWSHRYHCHCRCYCYKQYCRYCCQQWSYHCDHYCCDRYNCRCCRQCCCRCCQFHVANDVVTFMLTVGISNAGEIAVLILVAVNIVDAAFNCVVGRAA